MFDVRCATRTNETGCNEGAEATRCVSHEIEGVRSHVERYLMHGPNSRASVQANTAAVGYTAFATVQRSGGTTRNGWTPPNYVSSAPRQSITAASIGNGNQIPWGTGRQWSRFLVLEPQRLDRLEGGHRRATHLPQRAANATN